MRTQRNTPSTFILGLLNEPFTIQSKGLLRAVGIRFFAWGFYDLIQLPLLEPVLELRGAFDDLVALLSSSISQNNIANAIQALEDFLLNQIKNNLLGKSDSRVTGLAKKYIKTEG